MEEQKRSSMILFLSKYLIPHADAQRLEENNDYIVTEKNHEYESYIMNGYGKPMIFSGNQTNDAPVRFLLELSKRNGEPIEKIFCIVSETVYNEKLPHLKNSYRALEQEKGETAYNRFSTLVEKEAGQGVEIIPIYYDFDSNNPTSKGSFDSKEMATHIYNQIENQSIGEKIYIDYTGGLRDSSFFMVALIRYLEFKGIECKDIIYSDFFSNPKEIRNIRYIYDMFDMINGVSEFVGTGNARQLIKLQEKLEGGAMSDNVKDFVGSLQSFSAAIALCRVDDIEKSIEEITDNIKNLEDDTTQDIFVQMFKTLIPTVKEKLYIDKASHSILDLAQWCLENNMLQQAVTIYNERILFYYYENYDKFREILENGKAYHISKKDAKDLWEDFNKSIKKTLDLEKEANSEVKKVYNKYSKEVEENSENLNCIIKDIKSKHSKVWYALEARYKSLNNNEKQTDMMEFLKNFFGKNTTEFGKVIGKYQKISGVTAGIEYLETQDLQLWNAIKYYHAVKIIRNSINHVSDGTSDMNGRMREYLEKKGLGKTTDTFKFDELTKDFISNILKAAIACSREVCKKPNTP